jgi:hypothetical protein
MSQFDVARPLFGPMGGYARDPVAEKNPRDFRIFALFISFVLFGQFVGKDVGTD